MHVYEVQAIINESQKKALTEIDKLHAEMDELNSKLSPECQFDSRVWYNEHHIPFFRKVCDSSKTFIDQVLFHLQTIITADKTGSANTAEENKNDEKSTTEYKLFTL